MLPENHNKKCFIPEIRDESSHESVLSGLTVEQSKAFKVHLADIAVFYNKYRKVQQWRKAAINTREEEASNQPAYILFTKPIADEINDLISFLLFLLLRNNITITKTKDWTGQVLQS